MLVEEEQVLLENVMTRINKIKEKYEKSARYYSKISWYLNLPSILLNSAVSILSFLSSSELLEKEIRDKFVLSAGVIAGMVTLMQAVNSTGEFTHKKIKFIEATNDIDALVDKIFFEMQYQNEELFLDNIEKELLAIKANCKFIPL